VRDRVDQFGISNLPDPPVNRSFRNLNRDSALHEATDGDERRRCALNLHDFVNAWFIFEVFMRHCALTFLLDWLPSAPFLARFRAVQRSQTTYGSAVMDIVDSQVHVFFTLDLKETLAAMNAIGILTVVIDEYWGAGLSGELLPAASLRSGGQRPLSPLAQAAVLKIPDRFAILQRVERADPAHPGFGLG